MPEAGRILIVEGSGRGFLGQYAGALALGLQRAGRRVRVVTAPWDELAHWPAPFERRTTLRPGMRGWLDLLAETRAFHPDVVHFQWLADPFGAALYARWARARGIALVYTPHNLLPHRGRWALMPAFRSLYRVFDRIIVRDEHMLWAAHEMLGVEIERMTTIPGSPNLIAWPGAPRRLPPELPPRNSGELRVLHFGHGCARKGLAPLLAALGRGECPAPLHLVLAGAGVVRAVTPAALGRARSRLRLTVVDRYLEPDEVGALFGACDLVAMPYAKLCRSPILDLAAAFRRPVLRTDRVEATRFVEGLHGLTVAGGAPEAFAEALRALAGAPGRVARMSARLAAGPDFDAEAARLALAHCRAYDDALPGRAPAPSPLVAVPAE